MIFIPDIEPLKHYMLIEYLELEELNSNVLKMFEVYYNQEEGKEYD